MKRLLASWFGVGLILHAVRGDHGGSGTLGALITFPIAFLIGDLWGWQSQLVGALVISLIGLWSVAGLVGTEGDAGWIVIDEAGGTFLAVIGLGLWPAMVAWVVFRVADIFKKPFPGVSQAERLPGAWGVMSDDLVAALYALLIGHIIQALV
ncbi:MAG: phosphatidylglycerophosphatase A [Acidimicrobiia bacterium]